RASPKVSPRHPPLCLKLRPYLVSILGICRSTEHMTTYTAPIADMRFAATRLAGYGEIAGLPGGEELSDELLVSILEEGGKFAAGVLAPLNRIGDLQGSRLENGVVRTPEGWASAYRAFVDGGWNAVPFDPRHGGQGL